MQKPGYFDAHSQPLDERLAAGLYQLGLAVKHHQRVQASEAGLSGTQAEILTMLSREGDCSPSDVSQALGVSLPTISDSVSALVSKGLVHAKPSRAHHRARILALTRAGRIAAAKSAGMPEFLTPALSTLSDAQQEGLLSSLLLLFRALVEEGHTHVQRMCLTCTAFRPNVRTGPHPHHCALVNAPMRSAHLRLICDEHELASSEVQGTLWQQLVRQAV